ncbi:MAG TPA: protein kinase [Thermoanaerobaculia bacterium]|nr:protein kinase [Thermoanaerobaculia bacterium]
MIGRKILHYNVTSKLGTGGMGVVYEAEDTSLGRQVALKFLPPDMAQDDSTLQRFQREARAASALNHPNICTVHSIDQFESDHFIVMELLEGMTLAEKLRQGSMEIGEILEVSIQIVDALESAHSKGIVHRDLKPANIFITSRKQAKILDFGLAKIDIKRGSDALSTTAVMGDELTAAGTVVGTVSYMSPEQARAQLTDARTDLFSLGTVLYQMAAGALPFPGESAAVVFEAILSRDPVPLSEVNPSMPAALNRILEKALEKDRNFRYQTATELKTDLLRLRRDLDSGSRRGPESGSGKVAAASDRDEKSVAVLYFENLSGVKEDEYLRDGITEDIITELSKIGGLKTFSRASVLVFRDRQGTSGEIGQQLGASYFLTGSLRRAGNRLRINAQLVDTTTNFPLWSDRYDREMKDIFEVQDEIACSIADALRITLSPQEQQALATKPTEDLQAYDLYLRGRTYARRLSRQDLDFALQMFENAVTLDPEFALAHAGIASVCSQYYYHYDRSKSWIARARAATDRAGTRGHDSPEVLVAESWVAYAEMRLDDATTKVRAALKINPDVESGFYLLGRILFAAGKYQEVIDIADEAMEHAGENYNTYIPIGNALNALGKADANRNQVQRETVAYEAHLRKVPEDARARVLVGLNYAQMGRPDEAVREANLAMALRPDDAIIMYNVACLFCALERHDDALVAIRKAYDAGFRDPNWARKDPDLATLHGNPDFDRMYPPD